MMLLEVFIPTLNEAHRLAACVQSIWDQQLPGDVEVQVTIVDAGSHDGTVELARQLGLRILDNSRLRDPEAAKQIGFRAARGDFLIFMDADMQCAHRSTFASLLRPLLMDETICASFGRYVPRRNDFAINRALSMNALQCDPFYQAFLPEMDFEDGIVQFTARALDIPPIAGTTMYRMKAIATGLPFVDRYFDVDVPVHMARSGHGKFWYASEGSFFHGHISSFRDLIRKRLRNLDNGHGNGLLTIQQVPRVFEWLTLERFGLLRTVCRAAAAASGVALLPRAVRMYHRHKDAAAFLWIGMGPVVAFTLCVGVLRSSRGRAYLLSRVAPRAEGPAGI